MAMTTAVRSTLSRLLVSQRIAGKSMLPAMAMQLQRSISSKATREIEGIKRRAPFDYKNKDYNIFNSLFDKTMNRLDDNSKIILIEGPAASGKTAFGEQLAKDLDMMFVPGVNLDEYYVNYYGYDLRQFDHTLPVKARTFDTNDFLKDPRHVNVAAFQVHQMRLKYEKYFDAIAHILNTGQGVVLERSYYSDFVFVEAMFRAGYISKTFCRAYYEMRENTRVSLLQPHLVIYLDVPVPQVLENIKKRNAPFEVQSEAMTNVSYLKDLEYFYKHEFLNQIGKHAELLIYDWSNGGEVELVIEDIERMDFNPKEIYDPIGIEWRQFTKEPEWRDIRAKFTNYYSRDRHLRDFDLPLFYCEELVMSPEESEAWWDMYQLAPGGRYEYGYNEDQGDKILWKSHTPKTIPRVPRK